jgi:hypothetical protein
VKRQQFAKEVAAEVTRVLTMVFNSGFPGFFQKLYEHKEKCVTAQQNCFEGNVVAKCKVLISV